MLLLGRRAVRFGLTASQGVIHKKKVNKGALPCRDQDKGARADLCPFEMHRSAACAAPRRAARPISCLRLSPR